MITQSKYYKYKKLHRELWDWYANHGIGNSRGKAGWPRWVFNGGDIDHVDHSCFACEVVNLCAPENNLECTYCPVIWGGYSDDFHCCSDKGSPYYDFTYGSNNIDFIVAAMEVADIKWMSYNNYVKYVKNICKKIVR